MSIARELLLLVFINLTNGVVINYLNSTATVLDWVLVVHALLTKREIWSLEQLHELGCTIVRAVFAQIHGLHAFTCKLNTVCKS